MKITHIIFAFNTGGAETMLVDIVNEQCKCVEVSIIIINNKYNQNLIRKIDSRIKVHFINRSEGSRNLLKFIELNTLLFSIKSDVIHCHNHNIIPLLLPFFWKKAILTLHCLGIPTKYLSKYNKLFAISEAVKNDIEVRISLESKVIYNGISTALVKSKVDYSLKPKFRIISVGRLEHLTKGQHLAIEALHIVKKGGINDIQLDFIGSGSSEQFLKALTIDYGLTNCVNFLGLKDRDYIYAHIKDYNLLIQPSLYEGFGLTIAEGMAAKIPVLVSDVDGPMEIIDNGEYGYYFESGNPQSLADQLNFIISNYNSEDMKQKIESAYTRVKNCFDIKETASKYIEEYQKN